MKINKSKIRETIKDIIREETQYQIFFKKALKKFGVSSPDEFESEEKKKEFFDYVDDNWKADDETTESVDYNEDTEYQKFFRKALKKFNVDAPDDLDKEKKKEFFNYVDKHWQAKDERKESIKKTQVDEAEFRHYVRMIAETQMSEAKYNTKADVVNGYLKGEIDMKELKKYSDSMGVGIAKKSELEALSKNKFLRGMMADTHGVSERDIEKKVKDLLKNKMYESINEDKSMSGKELAKKMKSSKTLKGFADKVSKMNNVTEKDLDNLLPDYIAGNDIAKLFETLYEMVNEADDSGIKYGKDGHVKHITGLNGKKQKEVKVDGKVYRYNSTYKTYNSVKGNELLHKNDVEKAKKLQREGRLDETKFFVWWKKKKHEVEADSLYKAKKKFIDQHNVPKSQQSKLAIKSAGSMDKGDFRFS